ncbi:MAG TPA: hypothetical protein PKH47_03400 [Anaerolineales bacterium]|nr:hypothetical protein [Anaerolineales bacterium]
MEDLLQQGIVAYKAGKRIEARNFFISFVKQNPHHENGWGWMYQVSGDDKERIYCLKQMLRINPKNEKANELLIQITNSTPPLQPPTIAAPTNIAQSQAVSLKNVLIAEKRYKSLLSFAVFVEET